MFVGSIGFGKSVIGNIILNDICFELKLFFLLIMLSCCSKKKKIFGKDV